MNALAQPSPRARAVRAIPSLRSAPAGALSGRARVPGDKSISHRALIVAALAVGESRIDGLLEAEDIACTARALAALGAGVRRLGRGRWSVAGVGIGGLVEPDGVLDLGNSGTGVRLLMGVVATQPMCALFTGDESLRRRPMGRVTEPLALMGARVLGRTGGRLPLALAGSADPVPIAYRLPVPSAQVKSAILLAGLGARGRTSIIEPAPSRDHSEVMLRHFGAAIEVERVADGGRLVTLQGQPELSARPIRVPGDPSAAAFLAVAATIVPGSDVMLTGIGFNPLRTGLYETLMEMGAAIEVRMRKGVAGEPLADLRVRAASLRAVEVPAERAARMIDEYPILAVAAACAEGRTVMHGLAELRVKESDRIALMARGLAACGVDVEAGPDWLAVRGSGAPPAGGATVASAHDHRIAMAFLVLGAAARAPVAIDDSRFIATSFPDFAKRMNALGADIRPGASDG